MGVNRPGVFLDRDGTLIEEMHYLARPHQVALIPGAAEAVRRLNLLGIPVVVVTNQSGIARGSMTEAQVEEVHDHLDCLLGRVGARIDGYFFCPHHPEAVVDRYRLQCDCRKPLPGLLHRATATLGIRLAGSCMIGDRLSDLEAGARAGCRPLLVRTGYGAAVDPASIPTALDVLAIADALPAAVDIWLRTRPAGGPV
jgi:D-glycero-D-manno-heptose 1,7-bisphosphate phosphatase